VFGELLPGQEPVHSKEARVLLAVGGVSTLVLLMACGNVANLLLLSGLRRTAELSMKAALGATRGRLLREILFQAVLLAGAAGIGSMIVVLLAGGVVRKVFLPPLAVLAAPLDARVLLLAIGICAGAALALGLLPALRLSAARVSTPGHGRAPAASSRLLDSFVALQVAVSVPLLVGTGLFAASAWQAAHVDFGTETSRVTVVSANLADDGRADEAHAAHRRIHDRLRTVPGVTAVSMVQGIQGGQAYAIAMFVPGFTQSPKGETAPMVNGVDPSYFDVMQLRLVAGRRFTEADNRPAAPQVAVVNEAIASKYWRGQSPIGRCIMIFDRPGPGVPPCTQVVGVVAKASWYPVLGSEPYGDQDQVLLLPIERFGSLYGGRAVVVRTVAPPRAVLRQLQQEAQAAAADLPYVDAYPFDDNWDFQYRPLRLGTSIFLGLSTLALVIAVAGLAVVTAHGVTRRTREMGIRLVLGARPGDLVRLMARRTLVAMTIGLAAGATLAYVGTGALATLLYGVEPGDPRIFAAVVAALFVIGGLAAWIPARRTGRIDPSAALRIE
jgi:predicted permease